jgi:hypothetical protein
MRVPRAARKRATRGDDSPVRGRVSTARWAVNRALGCQPGGAVDRAGLSTARGCRPGVGLWTWPLSCAETPGASHPLLRRCVQAPGGLGGERADPRFGHPPGTFVGGAPVLLGHVQAGMRRYHLAHERTALPQDRSPGGGPARGPAGYSVLRAPRPGVPTALSGARRSARHGHPAGGRLRRGR